MAITIKDVELKALKFDDKDTGLVTANDSPEWFDGAFRNYWGRIYQLLKHLTVDSEEAEDLTLEVFWRLYRRPPRQPENLSGWLHRVAANLGYNALRSRKRRQYYEEQAGRLYLEKSPAVNPAQEAERSEERDQVRQVLGQMKPKSAKLLVLRHSGLSYKEIAQALNLSPTSIGALLARAEKDFERRYRQLVGE